MIYISARPIAELEVQSLSLFHGIGDLSLLGNAHLSLYSGPQPWGASRANSQEIESLPCFIGKASEEEGKGNQPVNSRRANITGGVENAFSRAG